MGNEDRHGLSPPKIAQRFSGGISEEKRAESRQGRKNAFVYQFPPSLCLRDEGPRARAHTARSGSPLTVSGRRCAENGMKTLAIGGVADHVHVLLSLPATMPVAKA